MTDFITRRGLIKGIGALGCSAAAFPLTTSVTFASAPWDNRLVVIILRGGMDGIDVVRPLGDPALARLRPDMDRNSLSLDGFYGAHPGLKPLMGLWKSEELAFVQAVSTPYRDKRSHFDGQDLLEAGTGMDVSPSAVRDGWLNRMLQALPGVSGETAFAIGRENMKILSGPAPAANWAPETQLELSAQAELLLARIYANDPLFHAASQEAMKLSNSVDPMRGGRNGAEKRLAEFAAERLRLDTRVAAFSVSGWDTHRNQHQVMGNLLDRLSEVILTLKSGLGPDWSKTAVVAMTEFGRTAAANGSKGTDHGTGGTMLLAGGAIRGGRVYGNWPGLDEASLYDRRDLMPTADVRAYAGWVMRGLTGLDASTIESTIFPGVDLGHDPKIML